MRYMRIVAAVALVLSGLQAAAQTTETNPFAGTGDLVIGGDSGDFITGGKSWHASASDGTWTSNVMDVTESGLPDRVRISFSATGTPKAGVGLFWGLDFRTDKVPGDLLVGAYKDAQRASFADPGHPGLDVDGDGRGCNTVAGTFTITAIAFDCVASGPSVGLLHLTNFAATFEQHCEGGISAARGTVTFTSPPGVACAGGGGGGGTPTEPVVPPDVTVNLPELVAQQPMVLSNGQSSEFNVTTSPVSSFNGPVALSIGSDALETDNFSVSISPEVIPAPGAGEARVKISTSPTTFPRDYHVTIYALANEKTFATSFVVSVTCDPPVILGIDQPRDQTVNAGVRAIFQVKAVGTGPFQYQWYRGRRGSTLFPFAGANTDKLEVTGTDDLNLYWVRLSNACGSVDSTTVSVAPSRLRAVRR